MTRKADLKRRVRARMARTGESYAAARAQLLAGHPGLGRGRLAAALHVTNGDSTADILQRTGLAERILPWRDVLHDGPIPAGADDRELRQLRAAFLAGEDDAERDELLRWLEHRDQELAANRDGEYVLWFEADLYDQLQLTQILAGLAELGVPPGRITLICIGEYPGIAHFGGLGELRPEQLHGLLEIATPLGDHALRLAAAAWVALRAADPSGLGTIAATSSPELRFLAEAFDRLSREYPSTRDGLSLTERRILAAAADGAGTAGAAHARVGAREARPYLADLFCFRIITRLVRAPVPLLDAEPAGAPIGAGTGMRLTDDGLRVLGGQADHAAQGGVDRWIGGVHLGDGAGWRWDEGTEAITLL
jgi:hypothetical protein